jgi:hypothetical protein
VLGASLTAEANPGSASTSNPFNFQRHRSPYPKPTLAMQ